MSSLATRVVMHVAVFALLLGCASIVHAEERIVAFEQRLAIQADSSLQVTETLLVKAEAARIVRGIYRDFPTDYRDRNGRRVRVGFAVESVTRDGASEQWHSNRRENGVRVYIGDEDVLVPPGEHRYVLTYRTTLQLGFFADHDELYWNVTGNGWLFPIDAVSADITLPASVPAGQLQLEGWTGPLDSAERAVAAQLRDGGGRIHATRPLAAGEGMTIGMSFPKGIVTPPTLATRVRWWLGDNRSLQPVAVGVGLLWLFYLWQWWWLGRDPARGVVLPEYEAPDGLPPSLLAYVREKAWSEGLFAADLMHLAERGHLRIEKENEFELEKLRDANVDDAIGTKLMQELFASGARVTVGSGTQAKFAAARKSHKELVEAGNGHRWFRRNTRTVLVGGISSTIAIAIFAGISLRIPIGALVFVLMLAPLVVTAAVLLLLLVREAADKRGDQRVMFLAAGAFLLGITGALALLVGAVAGRDMFIAIAAAVLTNALFTWLMPAYTREGRRLLDRIEGFVTYLSVAEKDDLARMQQPPMSGERFSQFLPYAQALDVEDAWTGKLVAALGATEAATATSRSIDRWYRSGGSTGSTSSSSADKFGSAFGKAITSASSPPGSSSYRGGGSGGGGGGGGRSSGGGRSGGGGGGGGGGGW